jgi:murein DD-endopeptidase MepM/ murein hydrolase activator NlpD
MGDHSAEHGRCLQARADAFEAADRAGVEGWGAAPGNWFSQSQSIAIVPGFSWTVLADALGLEGPDEDGCPPWWARLFPPLYFLWSIFCRVDPEAGQPVATTATPTVTIAPTLTPDPTATPVPTATPLPLPSPTAFPVLYVFAPAGANLRDAPGLQSQVLMVLPYRATLSVTGSESPMDDHQWVPVQTQDGQAGWVAGDLLDDTLPAATGLDVAPLGQDGLVISGNAYGTEIYADDGTYRGLHPGVDISATDTEIRANVSGNAYFYQDDQNPGLVAYDPADPVANDNLTGFGNFVILESEIDGETYYQVFAHMEGFEPGIDQGAVVDQGTLLGLMGSTGKSTGPRVHWEIRREDAVTIDADGVHGFSTWYPQDEEEMNTLFVNPDDFAGMIEPPVAP